MNYPIFITTSDPDIEEFYQDRYLYFVKTVNSLKKSNASLNDLYIFDDHSEYTPKLQFLLQSSWEFYVKYRSENVGPTLNTIWAIDYLYGLYKTKYIVFVQDDVIFNRNWLKKGVEIFKKIDSDIGNNTGYYTQVGAYQSIKKIGILCLYNRVGSDKEDYYLLPDGHPGGVAWIIKRDFWTDYKKNYKMGDACDELVPRNERNKRKKQSKRNLIDYKLCHRAHYIGWDVAKVGKSLVQHIGDWSSLDRRNMTQHRSKNFIGE